MQLIQNGDIKQAIKVSGPLGKLAAAILMRLLKIHKINTLYDHVCQYRGRIFIEAAFQYLQITSNILPEELQHIPKEGAFITVSNHPFGMLDGLLLINTVASVRPDYKALANYLLTRIPNLAEFFLAVNPFESNQGVTNSTAGIRRALEHIQEGSPLGIFPAGEVSTYNKDGYVEDKAWNPAILKLIHKAKIPVVPIYFSGTNSTLFHELGTLHPTLRTARLPAEMLKKAGKSITMRIGRPITPTEQTPFATPKELGDYLRARVYALKANIPPKKPTKIVGIRAEPIAPPPDRKRIVKEVDRLSKSNLALFTVSNYTAFYVDYTRIPYLMLELGRKREEAFRSVGEGTNLALDIDSFDKTYKHLILWDKQRKRLAGAYRVGLGSEILQRDGLSGFYTSTLFGFDQSAIPFLNSCIELGRSFVCSEYQKDPLALMLLLKGLMHVVLRHEGPRYLVGPVSISSWYPVFYRSLIAYYLTAKHSAEEFVGAIRPKTAFTPDYMHVDPKILLSNSMGTIEQFERFMMRLSNNQYRLPTLVKKYLKINTKLICFNVDPNFNYCLDGYIVLDIKKIPRQELLGMCKDIPDKSVVFKRFGLLDHTGNGETT
ncbi:MAG: lysophospholipid acyltransferase family protein [Prevotellaceae bacterium]|jgi:putative hemolysin|nr:lysophospholipid acyltransferase family protein [Prevotellaceae bacterium]